MNQKTNISEIIGVSILVIIVLGIMVWFGHQTDSNHTEYCFDSNGAHWVAGDPHCNN